MILVDFSQIFYAQLFVDSEARACAQNPSEESRNLMFHFVANSIRSNLMMHKKDYGHMVVVFDGKSWRSEVFPNYKWSRKEKRKNDDSGIDWKFVAETSLYIRETLKKTFPVSVVWHPNAEADDIIGVLTKHVSENSSGEENMFGESEPEKILIISNDKDNYQLHRYKNVRQWSPITKKLVKPDIKPQHALIEKIVSGDNGDGIPSIKCNDNWYVDYVKGRTKAPSITKKYLQTFFESENPIDACLTEEERRNYQRNETLVSYEKTPQYIYDDVILVYNEQRNKDHSKMELMNFFVKNRMNNLLSKIGDFY